MMHRFEVFEFNEFAIGAVMAHRMTHGKDCATDADRRPGVATGRDRNSEQKGEQVDYRYQSPIGSLNIDSPAGAVKFQQGPQITPPAMERCFGERVAMKRIGQVFAIWVLSSFMVIMYLLNRPLYQQLVDSGASMYACIDWDASGHVIPGVCDAPPPVFDPGK